MTNLIVSIPSSFVKCYSLQDLKQVGKTTSSLHQKSLVSHFYYFNWDNKPHREKILKGTEVIAQLTKLESMKKGKTLIVFDEIHKHGKWKQFLKGFFDIYGNRCQIIVTGSAKLTIYKAGGDSLMGRYFLYRIHPLSIAVLTNTTISKKEIRAPKKINKETFDQLYKYGGFPEPFLRKNPKFSARWKRLRQKQLIEDIRDVTQIQELGQLEMLAVVIKEHVGQGLTSYNNLANLINATGPTIKKWL